MSSQSLINSGLRFFFLLLIQVFVFNQVSWGWGGKDYLFIFVYPLFVALLPLGMARPLVILFGFILGLSVDFFSETLGLHAAALCFTAYCRPFVLSFLEPRDGYNIKANPSIQDLGAGWMLRYLALLLAFHCLFFFLMQTFSILFVADITLKTIFTFPASYAFVVVLVLIFKPKA